MRDTMTLKEMLEKITERAPHFNDEAAAIIAKYPNLRTGSGLALGRIIAIAIQDFVCWAYDKPEFGHSYLPQDPGNGGV